MSGDFKYPTPGQVFTKVMRAFGYGQVGRGRVSDSTFKRIDKGSAARLSRETLLRSLLELLEMPHDEAYMEALEEVHQGYNRLRSALNANKNLRCPAPLGALPALRLAFICCGVMLGVRNVLLGRSREQIPRLEVDAFCRELARVTIRPGSVSSATLHRNKNRPPGPRFRFDWLEKAVPDEKQRRRLYVLAGLSRLRHQLDAFLGNDAAGVPWVDSLCEGAVWVAGHTHNVLSAEHGLWELDQEARRDLEGESVPAEVMAYLAEAHARGPAGYGKAVARLLTRGLPTPAFLAGMQHQLPPDIFLDLIGCYTEPLPRLCHWHQLLRTFSEVGVPEKALDLLVRLTPPTLEEQLPALAAAFDPSKPLEPQVARFNAAAELVQQYIARAAAGMGVEGLYGDVEYDPEVPHEAVQLANATYPDGSVEHRGELRRLAVRFPDSPTVRTAHALAELVTFPRVLSKQLVPLAAGDEQAVDVLTDDVTRLLHAIAVVPEPTLGFELMLATMVGDLATAFSGVVSAVEIRQVACFVMTWAHDTLTRITRENPELGPAWTALSRVALALGDRQEARRAAHHAEDLGYPEALDALGP